VLDDKQRANTCWLSNDLTLGFHKDLLKETMYLPASDFADIVCTLR